jgi:hypothetical protein
VSQRTETICDQCGARKGETNHWFFAEFAERSFTVYANSTRVPDGHYSVKWKDYCGHPCVMRALTEFFDSIAAKRKFEAELQEGE